LEPSFPERNGAQRQRAMLVSGMNLQESFATTVTETRDTYAGSATEVVNR
jgi:hypothetical protein